MWRVVAICKIYTDGDGNFHRIVINIAAVNN